MAAIKVIPAEPHHIPEMLEIAFEAACESPEYQIFEYDEDTALRFITTRVHSDQTLSLVVIFDGVVVGMMLAALAQPSMSQDWFSKDETFYVLPEYRGMGVLNKLVKKFEAWSKEMGIEPEHRYLGVTMGIKDAPVVAALKRMGYQYAGTRLRGRS